MTKKWRFGSFALFSRSFIAENLADQFYVANDVGPTALERSRGARKESAYKYEASCYARCPLAVRALCTMFPLVCRTAAFTTENPSKQSLTVDFHNVALFGSSNRNCK